MSSRQPMTRSFWIPATALSVMAIVAVSGVSLWTMDRSENDYRICEEAISHRNWELVSQTAERWSNRNRQDPEAWWFRAQAAMAKKEWEPAVNFLDKIPLSSRRANRAYVMRTEILFTHLHRMSDALATCERLLETNGKNCDALHWVIFIHAVTMRQAELLPRIKQANEANCISLQTIDYMMRADLLTFTNGYELIFEFLKVTPDDEVCLAAHAIQIAGGPLPPDAAQTLGDQTELAKCLRRFPNNPEVLTIYLDEASRQGDVEVVGRLLEQFTRNNQQDGRFWYYSGWHHTQLDEFDEAEAALRKAIKFYPCDFRSQQLLASILRRQGRKPEAERWAQAADLGRELKLILHKIPNTSMFTPQLLERIAKYAEMTEDPEFVKMIRRQLPQSTSVKTRVERSRLDEG